MKPTHLSRRSFLKSAALAAVAVPTLGALSACAPEPGPPRIQDPQLPSFLPRHVK